MRPTVWIMSQMVCIGSIGRIALGRVSGRPEAGAASGADRAGELVSAVPGGVTWPTNP